MIYAKEYQEKQLEMQQNIKKWLFNIIYMAVTFLSILNILTHLSL